MYGPNSKLNDMASSPHDIIKRNTNSQFEQNVDLAYQFRTFQIKVSKIFI